MMDIQINELSMYECLMNIMNFMHPGLYLHQLRVAMLADKIAEKINLSEQRREILLYASLIHDLGMVLEIDEQKPSTDANANAYLHAKAGYELLKDAAFFREIGEIILHHHDWWDGSHPKIDSYEMRMTPIESRIICLAEEATLYLEDGSGKRPLTELHDYLRTMSLHKLDPDLLRAFETVSFLDKFWQEYTWSELKVYFKKYTEDGYLKKLSLENFKSFAEILFALLVHWDMSAARHFRMVANVAATIAQLSNYDEEHVECFYIAGLLHDLGKVAVPKNLLAKTGEFTAAEYKIFTQHAYYTYWLLNQVNGLESLAKIAGYHHEFLDGTGYPFGLTADKLEEAKIVAIANIMVNLGENKKTHVMAPLAKLQATMNKLVKAGKVDATIVKIIFAHREHFQEDSLADIC